MVVKYEYYDEAKDIEFKTNQVETLSAQTFTVGTTSPNITQPITSAKFYLMRDPADNLENVFCAIKAVDGGGEPTGESLSSGTLPGVEVSGDPEWGWAEIGMTPYILQPSTQYAAVVNWSGGSCSIGGHFNSPLYPEGSFSTSSDSGASWSSTSAIDLLFEIWGNKNTLYSRYVSGDETYAGVIGRDTDGISGINPVVDRLNSISSVDNLITGSLVSGTSVLSFPGSTLPNCFILEQRNAAPADERRLWIKV